MAEGSRITTTEEVLMRAAVRILFVMVILFALAAPASVQAGPMSNGDVIKLVKAGMGEALILSAIDSSEPAFDISADALIKLKEAGVSDPVIKRVLARSASPATSPVEPSKGGTCRFLTSESMQAIIDGDKQINLSFREPDIDEDISAGSTIASFFTLGIAPEKGTVSARISGNRATNRIKSKSPVFPDLATAEGQSPEDAFALVRLEVKGNDRILIVGEASSSLFGGYKGRSKFREGTQIPLKLERIQSGCTHDGNVMNLFRGVPASPLPPGEYALLYGENFFDFGVDP